MVRKVEAIYKAMMSLTPEQAKRYWKLRKTNSKAAEQMLNSIFHTTFNEAKSFVQSKAKNLWDTGVKTLASTATAGAIMNAAANPSAASVLDVGKVVLGDTKRGADKFAEYLVPFYSGTKEQIKAVNDYLDGNIDKEEYYKRIGSGTLSQALDGLLLYVGGKAISGPIKQKVKSMFNKAIKTAETKGIKAANKIAKEEAAVIRNQAVKQNPKAMKVISENEQALKAKLTKELGPDITKQIDTEFVSKLTKEEQNNLTNLIKANAKELERLAKENNVKKSELPRFTKFLSQVSDLIKNSPKNVRNDALGRVGDLYKKYGKRAVQYGIGGLSLYDMWQEYQNYGLTDLGPKSVANFLRLGTTALPGGPMLKLLYSQLGYEVGDKLTRVALRRLGVKDVLSDVERKEMEENLRSPGMSAQLGKENEYLTGRSGKRYHVVNDKIYDFSTGQPTDITAALDDAIGLYQEKTAQNNDKIANIEVQKQQALNARQQGYDIPDEVIQNYDNAANQLRNENNQINQTIQKLDVADYADDENLIDSVYKKEIEPEEKALQIQQTQNNINYNNQLNELQQLIGQRYAENIDNYFTPENLALEYYQYASGFGSGRNRYISPEQFATIKKNQALYEVMPKIQNEALQVLTNLQNIANKNTELGIQQGKLNETIRDNYVDNLIKQIKANEDMRHNRMNEAIGFGNLNVNQQNANTNVAKAQIQQQQANIAQQQANTAQQRAASYQQYVDQYGQMIPYKQVQSMGAGLSGASMGGLTPDQFINSNEGVMRQVFPAAFVEQPQEQQAQQQSNPQSQGQIKTNRNMIQQFLQGQQ